MWLNHCQLVVIQTAFQLFLKLYSHTFVLWRFFKLSSLGVGPIAKSGFTLGCIKFKYMSICFLLTISTMRLLKLKLKKWTKFNKSRGVKSS